MASTPKPVRRARKAAKRKDPAEWYLKQAEKIVRAEGVPKPPTGKVSEGEQDVLSSTQYSGVPLTFETFPEHTINPRDPRSTDAGYDPGTRSLSIKWEDNGSITTYIDVPPRVWETMKKEPSIGRYVNRVLNQYRYYTR